jgi:putative transposase
VGINLLPREIVIDKSGANTTGSKAINKLLKGFGCPIPIEIVRRKYSNTNEEKGHRFIKRRLRPMLGFKACTSAAAKIDRMGATLMIRQGQITPGLCPFQQFAEPAT